MIEVKGNINNKPIDERIDWIHPGIYDEKSHIVLGLCHTRATDDIRISYDSERDGWVIEQSSIFEWPIEDKTCDPDWQEVAFIQAWGRE